jgi:hypothetical protein
MAVRGVILPLVVVVLVEAEDSAVSVVEALVAVEQEVVGKTKPKDAYLC